MKLSALLASAIVCLASGVAHADPCGMVPPVYVGSGGSEIKRTGPQKTYVFFQNGVEDIVLRPGLPIRAEWSRPSTSGRTVRPSSAPVQELEKAREEVVKKALADLAGMTVTVIDGEFPFDYMKKNNLTFSAYRMPKEKNDDVAYDAKNAGPGAKRAGILVEGDVDPVTKKRTEPATGEPSWYETLWGN